MHRTLGGNIQSRQNASSAPPNQVGVAAGLFLFFSCFFTATPWFFFAHCTWRCSFSTPAAATQKCSWMQRLRRCQASSKLSSQSPCCYVAAEVDPTKECIAKSPSSLHFPYLTSSPHPLLMPWPSRVPFAVAIAIALEESPKMFA